jgi:hypothetical protein
MIERHLEGWDLAALRYLFIENVGNLVCPTSWDLGESVRLALLSVTDLPFLPLASMAALAFLGAFVTSRRGRSGAPAADTVDAGPRSADMAKPLAAPRSIKRKCWGKTIRTLPRR